MPFYQRLYAPGHLQFITTSTYRRTPVFLSARFCRCFVQMHNNPVRRGPVRSPGDWPWSSWRFHFRQDGSILRMDRLD
ncbi:MAG: hypothetical protein LAP13_19185 [Acidobacteriia bacterium]|nr:hypothetical protein [Terriglobia bacterium]